MTNFFRLQCLLLFLLCGCFAISSAIAQQTGSIIKEISRKKSTSRESFTFSEKATKLADEFNISKTEFSVLSFKFDSIAVLYRFQRLEKYPVLASRIMTSILKEGVPKTNQMVFLQIVKKDTQLRTFPFKNNDSQYQNVWIAEYALLVEPAEFYLGYMAKQSLEFYPFKNTVLLYDSQLPDLIICYKNGTTFEKFPMKKHSNPPFLIEYTRFYESIE